MKSVYAKDAHDLCDMLLNYIDENEDNPLKLAAMRHRWMELEHERTRANRPIEHYESDGDDLPDAV